MMLNISFCCLQEFEYKDRERATANIRGSRICGGVHFYSVVLIVAVVVAVMTHRFGRQFHLASTLLVTGSDRDRLFYYKFISFYC